MPKTPRPFRLALAAAIAVGVVSGFASSPAFADSPEPPAPAPTPVSVLDLPALPAGSIPDITPEMPVGDSSVPETGTVPVEATPLVIDPPNPALLSNVTPPEVAERRNALLAARGAGSASASGGGASSVGQASPANEMVAATPATRVRTVLAVPRWIPKNVYLRYAF